MDTKLQLLNIGISLFSCSPYEAVGVQDIVEQAHVTKPTLYHHFGSKLGFYEAVFEHFALPYIDTILPKTVYKNDLVKNLNELACFSFEYFQNNPSVFYFLENTWIVSSGSELFPYVENYRCQILDAFEKLFSSAALQHGNLKGKEALMATLFIHSLRAQQQVILSGKIQPTPDLPYRLVHLFMYGIFS